MNMCEAFECQLLKSVCKSCHTNPIDCELKQLYSIKSAMFDMLPHIDRNNGIVSNSSMTIFLQVDILIEKHLKGGE